jgi:hypothetical protein
MLQNLFKVFVCGMHADTVPPQRTELRPIKKICHAGRHYTTAQAGSEIRS